MPPPKANNKKKGEKGKASKHDAAEQETQQEENENDFHVDEEDRGLISSKRQRLRQHPYNPYDHHRSRSRQEWLRPYWLGAGLFLALFSFWVLDTLKDPIFGALTGGNLDRHQPPAKLFSVCMTLALVCFLEYVSSERQNRRRLLLQQMQRSDEDVLDGGGRWSKMRYRNSSSTAFDADDFDPAEEEDRVSASIFVSIGVPYFVGFGIVAYLLQFNPSVALVTKVPVSAISADGGADPSSNLSWHVLGYFLYAGIESFGSIVVATFWSFANSTLSLDDAERYYGLIIAIAQLGAIAGSTMVTTHVWNNITLIVLSCLVILLHVLVMFTYDRRFPPTSNMVGTSHEEAEGTSDPLTLNRQGQSPALWSGVHLILRHNYVLLILGASCLYEVSLTCLNYQMTLMGWKRFEETDHGGMSFTQFMGHYGQMVNVSSLLLSSIIFPVLIRRCGLRITLRLFPSLLLVANVLAFLAVPGNLLVLFFSMSVLKAMTYSIHDPSKEILYLPTSNAIKFKSVSTWTTPASRETLGRRHSLDSQFVLSRPCSACSAEILD